MFYNLCRATKVYGENCYMEFRTFEQSSSYRAVRAEILLTTNLDTS